MANTYTCLHYHAIFSTKNRERWIAPALEDRIWSYLAGIATQNNLKPILVGGVDDHIHFLFSMPPSISVSEALKKIKGGSSAWVKDTFPELRAFGWQDGYGAFSVSKSQIPEITDYIGGQREHHRARTFQEEYRALLDKHEIQYDERYLCD